MVLGSQSIEAGRARRDARALKSCLGLSKRPAIAVLAATGLVLVACLMPLAVSAQIPPANAGTPGQDNLAPGLGGPGDNALLGLQTGGAGTSTTSTAFGGVGGADGIGGTQGTGGAGGAGITSAAGSNGNGGFGDVGGNGGTQGAGGTGGAGGAAGASTGGAFGGFQSWRLHRRS